MIAPGVEVDRYILEAEIGEGGSATVWRARHRVLGSLHAVKVLRIASGGMLGRLLQEGRIQSRLDHPNLVPVTDIVEIDGMIALIMPFVPGPTLAEWLPGARPGLAEALTIAHGVLDGLEYAHSHGVIHRDLKPSNILLSPQREGWVPRITDFGLARADVDESMMTRSGVGMGTAAYMAPEQAISAKDADARADLFSFGCVLYELVTGQRAFPNPELRATILAIQSQDFVPASDRCRGLPASVDATIRRCLEPRPSDRPQSCAAVRASLAGDLAPVARRRTPIRARYWAIGGAIAAVTLAFSALGWWASQSRSYPYRTGSALSLDGISGYVLVPHAPSLNLEDQVTLQAWVRPHAWYHGEYFPVVDAVWRLEANRREYSFIANDGPATYWLHASALDTWKHLTVTYDRRSRQAAWYADGAPVFEELYTEPFWTDPGSPPALAIGAGPSGSVEYALGLIDDVRLWRRILSPSEVRAVARGEAVDTTGLVGWWDFDELTGDIAVDRSGFGNHGRLIGGVERVASADHP